MFRHLAHNLELHRQTKILSRQGPACRETLGHNPRARVKICTGVEGDANQELNDTITTLRRGVAAAEQQMQQCADQNVSTEQDSHCVRAENARLTRQVADTAAVTVASNPGGPETADSADL